jgi:hypothetical protein
LKIFQKLLNRNQTSKYLAGLIQNICAFLNLAKEKFVPMDIVVGSAGGTTIVIKSKARSIMVLFFTPIRIKLTVLTQNPIPA